MAKLIVIQGGREKSLDFIDDFVFVGSADDSQIRVQGPGVGAKHCQILRAGGGYRVVDLGFPAGTHVNHEKVQQRDLHNGDAIRIGDTTILFKGGATPEAMPAGVAAPSAARTPAEVAAQKMAANPQPAARRPIARGGAQRPAHKEIHVAPQLQRAASQRQVLQRQNLRKGGLTGPQAFAVVAGIVVVVVIVGMMLMKSMGDSGFDKQQWDKADQLMRQGKRTEAIAALSAIAADSPNYGPAQAKLAELTAMDAIAQDINWEKNGIRAHDSLHQLIMQRLEPESGMFASKYKDDRPTQARYIVYRCEEFLSKYGKHAKASGVKQWLDKYKPEAPSGPMSFHDIYVQADSDRGRREFTRAWNALKKWEAENPGQDSAGVKHLLEDIEMSANDWWKGENDYAKQQIEKGNLAQAAQYYRRAETRLEAIPNVGPLAKQSLADLVKLAKQMNVDITFADSIE